MYIKQNFKKTFGKKTVNVQGKMLMAILGKKNIHGCNTLLF